MPVYTELPCYNLNITEALGKRGCNCPVYGGGEINTVLPFTPNARACSCMLQSIDCVIRPGLDEETIRNSERARAYIQAIYSATIQSPYHGNYNNSICSIIMTQQLAVLLEESFNKQYQ
jgi:hypothetical protein